MVTVTAAQATPSEVLAHLIVGISFFGLGLAFYLAIRNTISSFKTTGHERVLNVAYAVARFGFIIVFGLVTEAVTRAGAVLPEWRAFLYAVGALMVGFGYLGVAIESRKVKRKVI